MSPKPLHEQRPAFSQADTGVKELHKTTPTLSHTTMFGKTRYHGKHPQRRRNDLLLALGFLELANALDFAANVWNQTPPPTISVVFMVLGGTAALVLLILAMRDMPRSWRNYTLLKDERKQLNSKLESLRTGQMQDIPSQLTEHDLQTHLNINYREMGNEIIDRFLMGLGLGFGALTVSAGTYLAIAGANPSAFHASNILTSYLGNVPTVIYGLMNGAWCIYGWRRAQAHVKAIRRGLPCKPWGVQADVAGDIRRREAHVKMHALINGFAGVLGGVGGLMTATAYIHPDAVWGYLVLIPSIFAAVFANVVWRRKINYDRDVVEPVALDAHDILNEAGFAHLAVHLISELHAGSSKSGGWLFCKRNPTEEPLPVRLQNFLLEYAQLSVQKLAQREAYLNVAQEKNSSQPNPSTPDHGKPSFFHRQEDWDKIISDCTKATDTNKPLQPTILINGIMSVLCDLNTMPEFLARLGNNANTACLLASTMEFQEKDADGVEIDSNLQKIQENSGLGDEVSRIACDTLADEGLGAAKSRARYSLELVGAFLQDR